MSIELDDEEWSRKPLPKILGPALLPCPFCGAAGIHAKEMLGGKGFVAKCSRGISFGGPDECDVAPSTLAFISSEYAAEAWNTRSNKKKTKA